MHLFSSQQSAKAPATNDAATTVRTESILSLLSEGRGGGGERDVKRRGQKREVSQTEVEAIRKALVLDLLRGMSSSALLHTRVINPPL